MKKTLAALLAIALLCAGVFALAEEEVLQIDITFDGTYLEDEELGFKILLPSEWNVLETEDYRWAFANDDETQVMAIEVLEVEGYTLSEVAEGVAAEGGMDGLAQLLINGVPYIIYEASEMNAFGGFTMTQGDVYCINFIFSPYGDAEFMSLAEQIMASIETL